LGISLKYSFFFLNICNIRFFNFSWIWSEILVYNDFLIIKIWLLNHKRFTIISWWTKSELIKLFNIIFNMAIIPNLILTIIVIQSLLLISVVLIFIELLKIWFLAENLIYIFTYYLTILYSSASVLDPGWVIDWWSW
jgi:hypothetical protein